jgi:hypothetical protein
VGVGVQDPRRERRRAERGVAVEAAELQQAAERVGQPLVVAADLERQRVPEELADIELGHRFQRLAAGQPFDSGPGVVGEVRGGPLQLGEKRGDVWCTHATKFAVWTPGLTMTESGAYWVLHSDYPTKPLFGGL